MKQFTNKTSCYQLSTNYDSMIFHSEALSKHVEKMVCLMIVVVQDDQLEQLKMVNRGVQGPGASGSWMPSRVKIKLLLVEWALFKSKSFPGTGTLIAY